MEEGSEGTGGGFIRSVKKKRQCKARSNVNRLPCSSHTVSCPIVFPYVTYDSSWRAERLTLSICFRFWMQGGGSS